MLLMLFHLILTLDTFEFLIFQLVSGLSYCFLWLQYSFAFTRIVYRIVYSCIIMNLINYISKNTPSFHFPRVGAVRIHPQGQQRTAPVSSMVVWRVDMPTLIPAIHADRGMLQDCPVKNLTPQVILPAIDTDKWVNALVTLEL